MLALACAVVAGVTVAVVISRSPGGGTASTRARVYANVTACLLTGPAGVADPAVAPVWAGMEDASLSTHARVSYLPVTGPATTANALPFLGSLLVRGCKVVVAAGGPERAAVLADAKQFPAVKFVVFGAMNVPSNVTVLAFQTPGLRSAVAGAVGGVVG
jgi:hypothetical protein